MPVTFKGKMPLAWAERIANDLKRSLIAAGVQRVEICGSIRRRKEMVGDIDLVIDGDLDHLKTISGHPLWEWKEGGVSKATVEFQGMQVNLLRSDEEHWGAAIFYFTGPGMYNVWYRKMASKRGLLLNEKGLFDKSGKCLASRTEEEIYQRLGKQWKEPNLRGI